MNPTSRVDEAEMGLDVRVFGARILFTGDHGRVHTSPVFRRSLWGCRRGGRRGLARR